MWEILAELAVLAGDGLPRALRARRARRRLAAGLPARIPCSVRSERPGWPTRYTRGSLRFTPASSTAAFGSRHHPYLGLPPGGEFFDPGPAAPDDQDWLVTVYQPPGGGAAVNIQVRTRYLPSVRLALGGG
ncbi:hypothetical protein GCM10010430_42850 [Kitasatospora cystarginea]|uniref:Uncharacterized protein n=1 Tax=Kitasatospora cystarginea TaxID=58350 RepID=A0ABN3ECB7_9ACTN